MKINNDNLIEENLDNSSFSLDGDIINKDLFKPLKEGLKNKKDCNLISNVKANNKVTKKIYNYLKDNNKNCIKRKYDYSSDDSSKIKGKKYSSKKKKNIKWNNIIYILINFDIIYLD